LVDKAWTVELFQDCGLTFILTIEKCRKMNAKNKTEIDVSMKVLLSIAMLINCTLNLHKFIYLE